MKETELYNKIARACKEHNAHYVRIETELGLGIPDINICYNGRDAWLEGKILVGKTHRFQKELTGFQCSWLARRCAAGGQAWVIAGVDEHPNHVRVWRGSDAWKLAQNEAHTCPSVGLDLPEGNETLLQFLTRGALVDPDV